MTKLAIFGDSYVTHLENFTFGRMDVSRCRFFGVPGMSTTRKFDYKFKELKRYRPDVIFINLGGNDITKSTDVDMLVKRITQIVEELYLDGLRRIFVASTIERGSFPTFTGLTNKKIQQDSAQP